MVEVLKICAFHNAEGNRNAHPGDGAIKETLGGNARAKGRMLVSRHKLKRPYSQVSKKQLGKNKGKWNPL